MLIKSQLITQGSGSLGGVTLSRNRGGMYLRARAIPTDPATTAQMAIRAHMSTLVDRWTNILSPAEIASWNLYAANVPVIGRLGDPITLSGQQHFLRSNVPRLQIGAPVVDDGPATFDLGSFGATSFSIGTSIVIALAFDDTDAWVDEDDSHLIGYIGRPQNQTINFFQGPYQLAGTVDGDSVTAPTTPATLQSPFVYVALQRAFMRVRVTRADGRLSNEAFLGPETAT